jgi:hypothetical protein
MPSIVRYSTSNTIAFFVGDTSSTVQAGLTGLAYNSGQEAWYKIGKTGTLTQIPLIAGVVSAAWGSGKWTEVHSTRGKGWYEIDLPDAVSNTTAGYAIVSIFGATNMPNPILVEIQILDFLDVDSSGRVGIGNINGTTIIGNGSSPKFGV